MIHLDTRRLQTVPALRRKAGFPASDRATASDTGVRAIELSLYRAAPLPRPASSWRRRVVPGEKPPMK
jgi:hypothetical protein